ncbi:unnamed protein product, partial [Sphagnum balticum]
SMKLQAVARDDDDDDDENNDNNNNNNIPQSDTNRNHKNTHTTHTEIISCDNKILCKEEEHKYTNLVLKRGA